jgi:uncharacterized repeat protein (TIGR01451 family)
VKTLQESKLENGQQADYQVAVTNRGPSEAAGPVTVTDPLPSGLTYVAAHGLGWSCSAAGQTVTCTHADPIPSAGATTIALTVNVSAASGTVTNAATVSGPTMQTDPSGDRAAITSPVAAASPSTTTTEPAPTTPVSPHPIAAPTPAATPQSSRPLAITGASPATLLRITYILEAAGIALVIAASFGTRRRKGRRSGSGLAK